MHEKHSRASALTPFLSSSLRVTDPPKSERGTFPFWMISGLSLLENSVTNASNLGGMHQKKATLTFTLTLQSTYKSRLITLGPERFRSSKGTHGINLVHHEFEHELFGLLKRTLRNGIHGWPQGSGQSIKSKISHATRSNFRAQTFQTITATLVLDINLDIKC